MKHLVASELGESRFQKVRKKQKCVAISAIFTHSEMKRPSEPVIKMVAERIDGNTWECYVRLSVFLSARFCRPHDNKLQKKRCQVMFCGHLCPGMFWKLLTREHQIAFMHEQKRWSDSPSFGMTQNWSKNSALRRWLWSAAKMLFRPVELKHWRKQWTTTDRNIYDWSMLKQSYKEWQLNLAGSRSKESEQKEEGLINCW